LLSSFPSNDALKITLRRTLFAALVLATMAFLCWLLYCALMPQGFNAFYGVVWFCYAVTIPWLAIGIWNSLIGILLMRVPSNPLDCVMPSHLVLAAHGSNSSPITTSTAILVCIRQESPATIIRNLELTIRGLLDAGVHEHFHIYILSDSPESAEALLEEQAFEQFRIANENRMAVTYRRRENNTGYKAGNILDFCKRWGAQHDFALTLDADSLMSGAAVIRLVRVMQADAKLGILQGLVVSMPSANAFTRIFQFGMRLGMRSWTLGSAWWQADCGPYWGHNALLRLAPFVAHCELPMLNASGSKPQHILSHDQVEAVLMRRAGYDVRVLPLEDESWEQSPPTLLEFSRRDLRWCQGNLQYGELIGLPGLKLVSRVQLLLAMMMYTSAPAWTVLMIATTMASASYGLSNGRELGAIDAPLLMTIFTITAISSFLPKIASILDVLFQRQQRAAFGGVKKLCLSVVLETVFSVLISPVMLFSQTLFMVRLLAGRGMGWTGQTRDDHLVTWSMATQQLWPHTLFGLCCLGLIYFSHSGIFVFASFYMFGLVTSIPLAVVLSWPSLGQWMIGHQIAALPEETFPPEILSSHNGLAQERI
jgi:membrane glycosyltransferase